MTKAKHIKIFPNHKETLCKTGETQIGNCSTRKSYGPAVIFHYKETKTFWCTEAEFEFSKYFENS